MTLLKSQQNFEFRLKFPVHSHLEYMLQKVIKMTGVKLTVGRRFLIGIYWYQLTNISFIYSHLFIYSHKGGLNIGYYQTRVNTFLEFISNNADTFKELLTNNTTHFCRHQSILTFSKSYWQTILQTFPDFISLSNNTDISRVTGKQYDTIFQSLYQAILIFSESSFEIKL